MDHHSTDLTRGSVWKTLLRFSIPLVVSAFLQSIYALVDMVITGRFCGADGLSGVSNGGTVTIMITYIVMGLSTGGNITIGQFFGAKDEERRKKAVATTISFLLLLGLITSVFLLVLARPIMKLVGAPALEEAVTYLRICATGIFFVFGTNSLFAVIRAVGNSGTPLLIILLSAVTNVGLDFLLIAYFRIGVSGAAIATAASQAASFVCALVYVCRRPDFFGFSVRRLKIFRNELRLILKVGIPSAFLFCVNGLTFMFNASLANAYGVAASAGYGVSIRIVDLCTGFISAMMNAASTMAAQCIGAQLYDRIRSVVKSCLCITVLLALALGAVVYFEAENLIGLFNSDKDVIKYGAQYLHLTCLQPLVYCAFSSLHAVATGAGDAKLVMWNCILGLALPRVILSLLLNHSMGLAGLGLSCIIAPLCTLPAALTYYRSNRWQHRLSG